MLSTLLKPIGVEGRSSNTGRQPFVPLHRAVALCGWLQASLLGLGAVAPHSAPARTPGVYAQRLCTMQSQQSIHSLSPRGRGLGIRQGCRDRTPKGFARTQSQQSVLKGIENLLHFYKNGLFLQAVVSTAHFFVWVTSIISFLIITLIAGYR